MLSQFRSIRGWIRTILHTRPINREFDRLGITLELLEARAAEIDAETPDFAQTRGKSWPDVGDASAAYLALLRQLPNAAGADALIQHFSRAKRRGR